MKITTSFTFIAVAVSHARVTCISATNLFEAEDTGSKLDYLEVTSRYQEYDADWGGTANVTGWEGIEDMDRLLTSTSTDNYQVFWYPDYETPWKDAGCKRLFPSTYDKRLFPSTYEDKILSAHPYYTSQLECCDASYPDQPGDVCVNQIVDLTNAVVAYSATVEVSATIKDRAVETGLNDSQEVVAVANGPNMLENQVICGYQGWFGTPGDGSPINRWRHWFHGNESSPIYASATIDMYPTTDEYDEADLRESGVILPDGSYAKFFSSYKPNVVLKHFEWMKTYGITGVFHHRFMSGLHSPKENATRTQITRNVVRAAEATGRKFAMSYDIAGTDNDMMERLKGDWMYLVDVVGVTNSSNYILQNGLPALHIFGIGLSHVAIDDVNGMQRLINWLRSPSSGKYRVWVLGGLPSKWRTQGNDSRSGYGWKKIFHSMDGIAPWHVARFSDTSEFDEYYEETIAVDATYCKQQGIMYMPTMWPGFSWLNLKKDEKKGISINSIPRDGGKFMWRMAYKYAANPNISSIWVAQFDEVDEGTAIFKVTPTTSDNPQPTTGWLALDKDGHSLPSDWYLRLTGEAQLMLEGKRQLTRRIPFTADDRRLERERISRHLINQSKSPTNNPA